MKNILSVILIILLIACMSSCKRAPEDEKAVLDNAPETAADTTETVTESNTETETEETVKADVPETTSDNTEAETVEPYVPDGEEEEHIVAFSHIDYEYLTIDEMRQTADIIAVVAYSGNYEEVRSDENAEMVYTDQNVTVERIIKGETEDNIDIRREGGKVSETLLSDSNDPNLKSGNRYLLFLRESSLINSTDTQSYTVICGPSGCFDIDRNGNVDTSRLASDDEISALQALYEE